MTIVPNSSLTLCRSAGLRPGSSQWGPQSRCPVVRSLIPPRLPAEASERRPERKIIRFTDTGHEGIGSSRGIVREFNPAVETWTPVITIPILLASQIDRPLFHYQYRVLSGLYIEQRIASYSHDVGIFPRLQRACLIRDAE